MNAFTEYAATLAQSIADLIAYHARQTTPRNRNGETLKLSAMDDLTYAHRRAVHETVAEYGNAYAAELAKATTAEALNELFRSIARDAISDVEDAFNNPHRADIRAKADAMRALAACIAGRDYRRDAMTEARRYLESRARSYGAQLGEDPVITVALFDEYARLGGDKPAIFGMWRDAFDAEKERRAKEAKREAARVRRQNQKGG